MQSLFSIVIRTLKALMLLFVVSVYMMSAGRLNALHALFHEEAHAVTHLDEDEADRCHRAIYHHDKEGCGHKTHLVEHSDCQICDFICNSDLLTTTFKVAETHSNNSVDTPPIQGIFTDNSQLLVPARAPPSFC